MVDPWEAGQGAYQRTAVVLQHFEEELNGGDCGVWSRDGKFSKIKIMLLAGGDLIESFGEPGVWSEPDVRLSFPSPLLHKSDLDSIISSTSFSATSAASSSSAPDRTFGHSSFHTTSSTITVATSSLSNSSSTTTSHRPRSGFSFDDRCLSSEFLPSSWALFHSIHSLTPSRTPKVPPPQLSHPIHLRSRSLPLPYPCSSTSNATLLHIPNVPAERRSRVTGTKSPLRRSNRNAAEEPAATTSSAHGGARERPEEAGAEQN